MSDLAILEPDTTLDTTTRAAPYEPGDHERFAHYAPKHMILQAAVEGTPIRALCGKVWVPTRDPNRFPVCPTCQEVFDALPTHLGDDE